MEQLLIGLLALGLLCMAFGFIYFARLERRRMDFYTDFECRHDETQDMELDE
ncbi:hypothetical protein [Marinibactrum halimedae]|uniref:Uncharacterized protein n=1 Tax=Marinibactrum halimedae TaxID=1444977 RepID=A0AA37TEY0_9GAMM|nr:hypothetical protein [Marinibactrum halimedae]MCD9458899.1 hypothetical protein [Marinibactrum halimedae]GLS27747.1 hypothetical protein GCM10007877_34660 [Marinibactrum halimedae]